MVYASGIQCLLIPVFCKRREKKEVGRMDIRELLSDGDLRSIGHVDAVIGFVGNDPERFNELMTGLTDNRAIVRMRRLERRLSTIPG